MEKVADEKGLPGTAVPDRQSAGAVAPVAKRRTYEAMPKASEAAVQERLFCPLPAVTDNVPPVGGVESTNAGKLMALMAYLILPAGAIALVAALSVVFEPGILRLATSTSQAVVPDEPVEVPDPVQLALIVNVGITVVTPLFTLEI